MTINTVYQDLPEKNHIHLNHDRWCPSQYSNWTPPKYKRDALPLEPIDSIPHEKNTVIWQQETLVWGSGFNFKLTDFSNAKKCKDWRTPYVLLLPVISITNPTVLAGKDNPPDERYSLWVRANISLLATYRLAQNHLPLDITCRNDVYETTSAKIAESCELITSLRDTHTVAILCNDTYRM
jgi:hypothetical protein